MIDLRTWMPIRIAIQPPHVLVDWCAVGAAHFADPFFDQTIERELQLPVNQVFRQLTPLTTLVDTLHAQPAAPPQGFIVHMSRCGSTLIAQMLAANPAHTVIAEPSPLERLLRVLEQLPDLSEQLRLDLVRGLLNALLYPRRPEQQHGFIKLDSWHTLEWPLLRRAYPDVPWIFIYREPVEVLVSQLNQPASWMQLGVFSSHWQMQLLSAHPQMGHAEYAARVLAAFCRTALDTLDERARLIHYRELPAAFASQIAPWFGLELTAADHALLATVAQRNAKHPSARWQPDAAAKQAEADASLHALAQSIVGPAYAELEQRRAQQLPLSAVG